MPTWSVKRARLHQLNHGKYKGKDTRWTGSKLQLLLVEKDFLYNAAAFHHVVPAPAKLNVQESALNMDESWRVADGHLDLGYFECRQCRQYSKHKFCTEVSSLPLFHRLVHKHECCSLKTCLCGLLPIVVRDDHACGRTSPSITRLLRNRRF